MSPHHSNNTDHHDKLAKLEHSFKNLAKAHCFEPNDATTWVTVKSLIANFLTDTWKNGELAGRSTEEAFEVQIGLGESITPDDILNNLMVVWVKVALVNPGEFDEIKFQQEMQVSQ